MSTEGKRRLVLEIIKNSRELPTVFSGVWPTCLEITVEYRKATGDNVSMATVRNHIKALEDEGCVKSFKLGREVLFAIVGWEEPK